MAFSFASKKKTPFQVRADSLSDQRRRLTRLTTVHQDKVQPVSCRLHISDAPACTVLPATSD